MNIFENQTSKPKSVKNQFRKKTIKFELKNAKVTELSEDIKSEIDEIRQKSSLSTTHPVSPNN